MIGSCRIVIHQKILYHIILYHIIILPIISYHIISYYIVSYYITSHHIISYDTMSYDIIPHHIISYHIIFCHIMLFDNIRLVTQRRLELNTGGVSMRDHLWSNFQSMIFFIKKKCNFILCITMHYKAVRDNLLLVIIQQV